MEVAPNDDYIRTAIASEQLLQYMPIDIELFEDPEALSDPPTSDRILRFLLNHVDSAFTRREIADAIDATPETVGTNLTRLKARGLVRHREPYWAIGDDRERVVTALSDRDEVALRSHLGGTDDSSERNELAAPQDEHEASQEPSGTDEPPDDSRGSTKSPGSPPSPHREAATAFVRRVREHLDTAIDAIYLFGSVARGSATTDSDVDILAVISDTADYATVDDQLLDIAYDVQLEYGIRIEVHSIRASDFAARNERGDPFIRTVIQEGTDDV